MRSLGGRTVLAIALAAVLVTLPTTHTTASYVATSSKASTAATALNSVNSYVKTANGSSKPLIYAKSYLLLDATTNTVLASQNPTTIQPMASTTKMMTALIARQNFKLDDVVTVHTEAEQIPETLVHLIPGEKLTVDSLLKAMLIPSGNDAAYSLAYYYNDVTNPGTTANYQPFVDRMNDFAAKNHLTSTHYGDAAGLDDQNGHSDAKDLAVIARLVLSDPVLAQIVNTPQATVSSIDNQYSHNLINSNRLIQTEDSLYLPGVIGVKTGFTPDAGHCLVAAYSLNGRILIGVVLNTSLYTATASAQEMRKLFLWAQTNVQVFNY